MIDPKEAKAKAEEDIKSGKEKLKAGATEVKKRISLLPFRAMLEKKVPQSARDKFPILNGVISFSNYIVCGIAILLIIVCFGGGGGGSGKFGTKEAPAGDFVYELNQARDGVVITDYKGRGGDIVIPSKIEGYPVVEFRANALSGFHEPLERLFLISAKDNLNSIKDKKIIKEYKNRIKEYQDKIKKENIRPSITSVVFPDSITEMAATEFGSGGESYISSGAFEGSFALKAVKFPKNIKVIPPIFSACKALTTIVLPENFEIISDSAFYGLNITSIVLPEGVKEIRDQAFRNCTKLTSVKIPDSIETIGQYAFENCSALARIDIPAKKIRYGSYNMNNKEWYFGEVFDDRAFADCGNLPLAERKKIEDTGYTGTFVSPFANNRSLPIP